MNLGIIEEKEQLRNSVTQKKLAYSVEEISKQTSLSKAFLRNEIRAGRLKAKLVGRRVLILPSDLEEYLNGKETWKPIVERKSEV